jgi:hypothetical protein
MELEELEFEFEEVITGDDTSTKPAVDAEGIEINENILPDGNELMDFGTPGDPIEDNEGKGNASTSSSDNLYLNFAKALTEKGVIDEFDDSIFESEDADPTELLMGLVKGTVDSNINEYRSKVSGDKLKALEALERGENIDAYLSQKNKAQSLNNISLDDLDSDENSETRKSLIREYMKETTNFSDARINKSIQRMVDLGEDVEEARDIYGELKETREAKATKALEDEATKNTNASKAFNDQLTKLRENVDQMDYSFLGSKASKKSKDKIYEMLTKPVSSTENFNAVAKKRNDMGKENFDIILAALINKGVFDKDMSKVSSKQRESAISDLETSMQRSGFTSGQGGNFGSSTSSGADEMFRRSRE